MELDSFKSTNEKKKYETPEITAVEFDKDAGVICSSCDTYCDTFSTI